MLCACPRTILIVPVVGNATSPEPAIMCDDTSMLAMVFAMRSMRVRSDYRRQHQDKRKRCSDKPLCNAISSIAEHQPANSLRRQRICCDKWQISSREFWMLLHVRSNMTLE